MVNPVESTNPAFGWDRDGSLVNFEREQDFNNPRENGLAQLADGKRVDLNWGHFSAVQKIAVVISVIPIVGLLIADFLCPTIVFDNENLNKAEPEAMQVHKQKVQLFDELKGRFGSVKAIWSIGELTKASWEKSRDS